MTTPTDRLVHLVAGFGVALCAVCAGVALVALATRRDAGGLGVVMALMGALVVSVDALAVWASS